MYVNMFTCKNPQHFRCRLECTYTCIHIYTLVCVIGEGQAIDGKFPTKNLMEMRRQQEMGAYKGLPLSVELNIIPVIQSTC